MSDADEIPAGQFVPIGYPDAPAPGSHGLRTIVPPPGPGAIRARHHHDDQPTQCARCGAILAGTGPLVAAWLETTSGTAVCSSECDS